MNIMEFLFETIFKLAEYLSPLIQIVCGILIVWKLYDIHKIQTMIYKKLSNDTNTPDN